MPESAVKKCCGGLRKALIPVSSLLTVGAVSYISYTYILVYAPALHIKSVIEGSVDMSQFLEYIFLLFPIYITWALLALVAGDPGHITPELVSKIYKENDIQASDIGSTLTMKDVIEILTVNYLKRQNIISEDIEQGDNSYIPVSLNLSTIEPKKNNQEG